jgi:hypothetical protein
MKKHRKPIANLSRPKPVDPKSDEHILSVLKNPVFLDAVREIKRLPNVLTFLKYPSEELYSTRSWDEASQRWLYSGVYFDVLDVCNRFGLVSPFPVSSVVKMLLRDSKSEIINDLRLVPPSIEQWTVWRMAKFNIGGFGYLREMVGSDHEFGLTRAEIMRFVFEPELIAPLTISNWVHCCRDYLLKDGDTGVAAVLAGFDDRERYLLLLWLDLQKSGAKSDEWHKRVRNVAHLKSDDFEAITYLKVKYQRETMTLEDAISAALCDPDTPERVRNTILNVSKSIR